MHLIAEVIIPQMFTAYAQDLKYLKNGLHHYQYFCEECDQVFASAWGRIPGAISYYERGSYFYCPNCGKKHHKNVTYIKSEEKAPNKVRLSVKVSENVVTLEVACRTVEFPKNDNLHLLGRHYKEVFRFNITKQTVSFTNYATHVPAETIELGNPYKLDVLSKSILWFFRSNSLANSLQQKELNRLLKTLRDAVHEKLEKHLGHKITSMFVSQGRYCGTFLLPIFNIACRVVCPDAPNLPIVYRGEEQEINAFWSTKMISNADFFEEIIAKRRKESIVAAMISTKALPDRPYIRRILSENPFDLNLLTNSFKLCSNYDYAVRMYEGLLKLDHRISSAHNNCLMKFLRLMKVFYGEPGIVRLVEEYKEMQLWDCIRLFEQLNKDNRKALKTESVKLKDLHDWMSIMHKKQTHVNLKFNVPEHIVKRLSMQKERLSFFLPEESMQLLLAGHELHNCVASYGRDMKDNQKWIVLVADDKGKLAACLEIKGNELVQAKLDKNKLVSSNAELNNAIVTWAREANIKIKTSDIKVPSKKKDKSKEKSAIPA